MEDGEHEDGRQFHTDSGLTGDVLTNLGRGAGIPVELQGQQAHVSTASRDYTGDRGYEQAESLENAVIHEIDEYTAGVYEMRCALFGVLSVRWFPTLSMEIARNRDRRNVCSA
jgi:hypothetical protein